MKIALAALSCDNSTGIGRVVLNLALRFAEAGHTVDLIVQKLDSPSTGLHERRVPSFPGSQALNRILYTLLTKSMLPKGEPDVTNSFGVGRGAMVVTAQSCHRSAVEVHSRLHRIGRKGWGLFDRVALADERAYMTADSTRRVIAVSRLVKNQLQQFYGLPESLMRVIPNGVDTDRFTLLRKETDREMLRSRLGVTGNDFVLLFVGNEFDRKGLQTVVESLGQLDDSSIKLVVIGEDDPEPFRKEAAKFGVESQIRFLGKISGSERFFIAADVFVLPTTYEPFGMVIIEAMAAGIPVITSAGAGAVEELRSGVHGLYLANPLSADELTETLRRIRGDRELGGVLVTNGLNEVRKFSWNQIAESTLSVYRELPGRSGGRS